MQRFIHGSEDSLDLDVFYVFNEMPLFSECQRFCSEDKNENRNIITIEDGIVSNCFKGTIDEINNGLYYTYNLHSQTYTNPILYAVNRNFLIKCIRVLRGILSYCSRTEYRKDVKFALNSYSWDDRLSIIKQINFSRITDFKKNKITDVYKVFAFQLAQVLALYNKKEIYTKSQAALEYPKLKKYLYRELSSSDDLIFYINEFINIIEIFKTELITDSNIQYCKFIDFNKTINLKTEKYIIV